MGRTQFSSREIGNVQRNDFDIITSGQAVITKILAGTNITISQTGVDSGTGDVTINASISGGGITRSINNISVNTTGAAASSTDYVYFCTGAITFTLPTAIGNTNRYTIISRGTQTLIIATTLSQTIAFYPSAPATTATIIQQGTVVEFFSDGANWWTI